MVLAHAHLLQVDGCGIGKGCDDDFLVQVHAGFCRVVLDQLHDGVYFVDRERRIVNWNRGAERITGWTSKEVIGKRCSDGLLLHIDIDGKSHCGSSCPLLGSLDSGTSSEAELFLRHKEGHRIPVRVHATPLRTREGEIVGVAEVFHDLSATVRDRERIAALEGLVYVDPLTGVANRSHLDTHLEGRLQELKRFGWPFGVVMFDVDHFKAINDNLGHPQGDRVLRMVAQTAYCNARPFDLVARYGGDEFVQVVSNVSDEALDAVAQRLCMLVRHSTLAPGDAEVTISVGATTAHATDSVETLLGRADKMLYRSKRAGRDRASTHPPA